MEWQRANRPVMPERSRVTRMVHGRGFNAATVDNLTSSFTAEHSSLNEDLERSLRVIRGRSRYLAKNNDYVKRFLNMVQNHVVGPEGFKLAVNCLRLDGTIDEADKLVCEKFFKEWSKRGVCDVTGRLSFTALCRLCMLMVARDGEAIVRRVKRKDVNKFGYALQVIDPVLLDDTFRTDYADGRRIRMGVETNAEGRVLAYHFLSDVESPFGSKRVRVDASEIWHLFIQEEPSQVRGVPWLHTSMRRLNNTGEYEEAAVIAARVGASQMGFYVPPADSGGGAALANDVIYGKDANGNDVHQLVKDATPGTFEELPPGYDFKSFDPDYPHQNFDPFLKAMLRGISSGMNVDYGTLSNDLVGATYSSIRTGKLESNDSWLCLQAWFKECALEPLWPELLDMGFVSGSLASLPISKYDKYNAALWQGRRWTWVDPENDMKATELELKNCLTSYSAVMRGLGRDPEAVWRELERDKARIKDLMPTPEPLTQPVVAAAPPKKE
ncbi:MAG: phage portal protein [Burkholderiaceae bacterium]